jgi:hypothetical protein
MADRVVVEGLDLFPDDGGFGFDDIVKKGIERMTTNIPARKMRVVFDPFYIPSRYENNST